MTSEENIKNTLSERGVCVVIPTYNNDKTIESVIKEVLLYCDDVIVINDGSTDNTASILSHIDKIHVVRNLQNKGKGNALKKGFKEALKLGFSYAITIDADGQHYPKHIVDFLKANQLYPGSIIVGSRNLNGVERSKGSNFANQFSNFWFYIQTGRKLSDTQTGYRLYPIKKLYGLNFLTSKYEAELELLVFPSWHGVAIKEIPINVYYPPKEERVSHFRPFADFGRISILNTILCILAIVYGLPLRICRYLARYIRTIYSFLFFSFFAMVVILPFVWVYTKFGKMTEKKKQFLHKIIYRSARFIMIKHGIPGTTFSYKINDHVDFEKPHVIICNHQSHLDLMCQLIFTPNIIFLTNDWVWNNPFYGLLIRNAEYLPVMDGIEVLLPKLKDLVDRGYSIAVYPEGTRSKDCKIGRFHQGAFFIAERLNLDLLPMCLYGTGKILPKKTYSLNKGPIYIEVDEPIKVEELKRKGELKDQASYMRKLYIAKYSCISNRIERNV